MVEAMLDTLIAYGQSPEARIVVFAIDGSFEALAHRGDITCIRCRSTERLSAAVKGAVYSAARFIRANKILAVEADMLVVGSLQPIWAALDVAYPGNILGVRPPGFNQLFSFVDVISSIGCPKSDVAFLTGHPTFNCRYWFNGGVIAGDREAFLALDSQMQRLAPFSILWMEGGSTAAYTDESLMNLSVGLLNNAAEISSIFNHIIASPVRAKWLATERAGNGLRYRQGGGASKILHFVSPGRSVMREINSEIEDHGLLEN